MSLFRSEVLNYQSRERLPGEIIIRTPLSSYLTTSFFTFSLICGVTLGVTVEYPKIESVRGILLPDQGLLSVIASRAGTVTNIYVADGDRIDSGQLLALIKVDESTREGTSAAETLASAAVAQKENIVKQISAVELSRRAKDRQVKAQRAGLAREISQLKGQIVLQEELITSAKTDLKNADAMARDGFVSKVFVKTSVDALTQRRLASAALQQSVFEKQTQLASLDTTAEQIDSDAAAQIASLTASNAQIDQQAVQIGLSGSYQIRAPMAGTVSYVSQKIGQPIHAQNSLMNIVPSGSVLKAEFGVPTTSIGFIRVGQKVKLAIDAFPYQKFGTIEGAITKIADSALSTTGPQGEINVVYPVTIGLSSQVFVVGNTKIPLKPSMTLGARIVTERRTFFEWVFEPFFSVWKRD